MRRDGTHPARPASARRLFREEPDGNLYDLDKRCLVSPTELGDALAAGATFRAYRHDTGADCTYEILLKLLALHPLAAIGAGSRELITTDAAIVSLSTLCGVSYQDPGGGSVRWAGAAANAARRTKP